ncbi:MAG: hypothetical protein AAFQ82_24455, partial [Myxococcota bacterium]
PGHLENGPGAALREALGAFGGVEFTAEEVFQALASSRSLPSFVKDANAGLDELWKKSKDRATLLSNLDAIADNESPDAVVVLQPWQAALQAAFIRENPERRGSPDGEKLKLDDLRAFLRDPESQQRFMQTESFCTNFARAFCAYTKELTAAFELGLNDLDKAHELH